jgi:heptosyltransferase-2
MPGDDWRNWLGSFDLVVSWLADRDGIFQQNVRAVGVSQFIQGPWKFDASRPVALQLADALTPLGITIASPVYDLQFCRREQKNILAVHPGSGSVRKNWPVPCWLRLLTAWHRLHPQTGLLIITGEAESAEVLSLPEMLRAEGIACQHSHGQSLTELSGLLAGCRLYLGHDTGISHLAASCQATCRLIFGPASTPVWVPPSPAVRVRWTDCLDSLSPGDFLAWLEAPV